MNIALLRRLRRAQGGFVPLSELSAERALEPARIQEDLEGLASFGFPIERHPYLGAALRGPSPRLCPEQIEEELNVQRIGRRIAVWDRIESTNDLAIRAAKSSANEGLIVLAEEQTAGRGRRGRSWIAPRGSSILMSVLLFPPDRLAHPAWLTALAAAAVVDVVGDWTKAKPMIKWPNDVRIQGRKVSGILVEKGQGAILGVGLNVFSPPGGFHPEIRATAGAMEDFLRPDSRFPLDRSEIVRELIQRLDAIYVEAIAEGPDPLLKRWRSALEPDAPSSSGATAPTGWDSAPWLAAMDSMDSMD